MMSLISHFVAWKWIINKNIFFKCSYLCFRDTGSLSRRIIFSSLWHNSHHPLRWMLKYLGSVWYVWAEGWSNSSQLWLWSSPACPPTSWKTPSPRRPESEEEKNTNETKSSCQNIHHPICFGIIEAPFGWNPSAGNMRLLLLSRRFQNHESLIIPDFHCSQMPAPEPHYFWSPWLQLWWVTDHQRD